MDKNALYRIGYGLYVVTSRDGGRDNGCINNTLFQITSADPLTGILACNKQNLTHDLIADSGRCNVSVLTTEAPFSLFQRFGFQSGRTADKFDGFEDTARSENGLLYLTKYANAFFSLRVTDTLDFGSHSAFKVEFTDGRVISDADGVTYAYYQQYIKPKPQQARTRGFRCRICGYVYEGDPLPEDFICPICKHGAADFERM